MPTENEDMTKMPLITPTNNFSFRSRYRKILINIPVSRKNNYCDGLLFDLPRFLSRI